MLLKHFLSPPRHYDRTTVVRYVGITRLPTAVPFLLNESRASISCLDRRVFHRSLYANTFNKRYVVSPCKHSACLCKKIMLKRSETVVTHIRQVHNRIFRAYIFHRNIYSATSASNFPGVRTSVLSLSLFPSPLPPSLSFSIRDALRARRKWLARATLGRSFGEESEERAARYLHQKRAR